MSQLNETLVPSGYKRLARYGPVAPLLLASAALASSTVSTHQRRLGLPWQLGLSSATAVTTNHPDRVNALSYSATMTHPSGSIRNLLLTQAAESDSTTTSALSVAL